MEESWLCIDEDSTSSNNSFYSDKIDSEVEAELYGFIHHQESLSENCSKRENNKSDEFSVVDSENNKNTIILYDKNESNLNMNFKEPYSIGQNNLNRPDTNRVFDSTSESCQKMPATQKRKSDNDSDSVIMCSSNSGNDSLRTTKYRSRFLNHKQVEQYKYSNKDAGSRKKVKSDIVSSDSDSSVIWMKSNTLLKTDLKTNVNDDTVCLSSDSFDGLIMPPLEGEGKSSQKDLALYKLKMQRNLNDLWQINEEDLYRRRKTSQRYHTIHEQCSVCNRKGHTDKFCSIAKVIKCFICGGEHLSAHCRNRMCSKCYETGHDDRQCWVTSFHNCSHCKMRGHLQKNCPDIWRRYHLTTNSQGIVHGKAVNPNKAVYCFNCGWPGHFGAVCKEPRRGSFPTWSSVINYGNPKWLLKQRFDDIRKETGKNQKKVFKRQSNGFQRNIENRQERFFKQQSVDFQKNAAPQQHMLTMRQFLLNEGKAPFRRERRGRKYKQYTEENLNVNEKQHSETQENKCIRERSFPRTPKKCQIPKDVQPERDEVPDFVKLDMKKQLQRRKKNMKRKIKRRQKKLKEANKNSEAQDVNFNRFVQI